MHRYILQDCHVSALEFTIPRKALHHVGKVITLLGEAYYLVPYDIVLDDIHQRSEIQYATAGIVFKQMQLLRHFGIDMVGKGCLGGTT